eukprot:TRINITY_DN3493_c0_g1_i2.p1 TRINITY_DN3493_c0_g1~~TRINITY_DN3493_c0_g1_i2.p1  ORF type:complete len:367 (+),score=122.34 TRINITY_DN3493_c0_g1_i2:31-1101(+)
MSSTVTSAKIAEEKGAKKRALVEEEDATAVDSVSKKKRRVSWDQETKEAGERDDDEDDGDYDQGDDDDEDDEDDEGEGASDEDEMAGGGNPLLANPLLMALLMGAMGGGGGGGEGDEDDEDDDQDEDFEGEDGEEADQDGEDGDYGSDEENEEGEEGEEGEGGMVDMQNPGLGMALLGMQNPDAIQALCGGATGGEDDIFKLMEEGELSAVIACVDEDKERLTALNWMGESPLHQASSLDSVEMVKYFLEKGADVNAKSQHGNTPLHWATHSEVCQVLIDAGANVNEKDDRGDTPLKVRCEYDEHTTVETIKVLLRNGADPSIANRDEESSHTVCSPEFEAVLKEHGTLSSSSSSK